MTTTRARAFGVSYWPASSTSCKPLLFLSAEHWPYQIRPFRSLAELTDSTTFFVIGFSTFLFSCIDYSLLSHELSGPDGIGRLDDVLVGSCLTG
jgi:hypothetical protein